MSEELCDSLGGPRQDRAVASFDDRTLDEVRVPHHEIHQLIVGVIAVRQPKRHVERFLRPQDVARSRSHLFEKCSKLCLGYRIQVVVDGFEIDARVPQGDVDLLARGAGWLLVTVMTLVLMGGRC